MERSKETISNVAFGASLSAIAGATAAAGAAVLKNAPIKQYTISTGLNCGMFGATFCLIRETFLGYQQSKNVQLGLKDSQTRDFDDLFSSTMAGITTGGLLSTAFRGPRAMLPGSVMFGAICAGMQVIYTAGNHWRRDVILQSRQGTHSETKNLWEYIRMPSWSPIREISNEEYSDLLDTRLKTLEAELQQIEDELRKNEAR